MIENSKDSSDVSLSHGLIRVLIYFLPGLFSSTHNHTITSFGAAWRKAENRHSEFNSTCFQLEKGTACGRYNEQDHLCPLTHHTSSHWNSDTQVTVCFLNTFKEDCEVTLITTPYIYTVMSELNTRCLRFVINTFSFHSFKPAQLSLPPYTVLRVDEAFLATQRLPFLSNKVKRFQLYSDYN